MASFISILSLFLLVLANGYLTLPLYNEPLQTSTMLSSNVDVTSKATSIPRELSMNQVQQTTESAMELQMTTSAKNLPEVASRDTRAWKETNTLSPWMLTTVESTTEDDNDNDVTTEDNTTFGTQFEPKTDKREVLPELTTNTLSLTSSSTSSMVNLELTTEESSSSKPSKKFTGSLKDKKDGEKDLDQEKKEKDDEDQTPVKPSKTYKKEKEDDKEKSDDDEKVKPGKKHKKEKDDDEDKVKPGKKHKKVKDDDKDKSDEADKEKSDEDSKKTAAPIAQLDSEGMKNVSNYQKEYMDLDENTTFSVTQSGSTESTSTLKYKKGKKPLNEGEESSTAKEEESNQ